MTCTCKAELASILRKLGDKWAEAQSHREDEGDGRNSAENAEDMAYAFHEIADALSPAPAETQEPCMVVEYPDGRFGIETKDSARFWRADKWHKYFKKNDPRWGWGDYTTRAEAEAALPAARAALLAASEPGKAAFVTGLQHACPKCGKPSDMPPTSPCAACMLTKPAPAPFDAAKWAERTLRSNGGEDVIVESHDGTRVCVMRLPYLKINTLHAWLEDLLAAAHEAGKAEAGQPRLRYEVLNAKKEVIAAFRDHYSATVFCNGLDGRSVVDTQPAPPAEKEPPHAN